MAEWVRSDGYVGLLHEHASRMTRWRRPCNGTPQVSTRSSETASWGRIHFLEQHTVRAARPRRRQYPTHGRQRIGPASRAGLPASRLAEVRSARPPPVRPVLGWWPPPVPPRLPGRPDSLNADSYTLWNTGRTGQGSPSDAPPGGAPRSPLALSSMCIDEPHEEATQANVTAQGQQEPQTIRLGQDRRSDPCYRGPLLPANFGIGPSGL